MSYIELHTASAFSFLRGASLPEALVARAAHLGYPAVALLDRDGVYGAPRFHKAARAAGITPIIGAELTLKLSPSFALPVLCESTEGYRNLCRLITRMKLGAPKGEGALTLDDLDGQVGGLIALIGRPLLEMSRVGITGLVDRLIGTFGRQRLYVELQRHLQRDGEAANVMLSDLAEAFRLPVIATNGVRCATPANRPLFDVLTCIHHHTDLTRAGRRLAPNAERYLKSPADMAALFHDRPEAIRATRDLTDRLRYTMADLGYRFPEYPVPEGETQSSFLRNIADLGARDRYRPLHDQARAQLRRELDLIARLNLAGYFLIVWDIVNFCRQHDVLVQGRGSAANSVVCYSLGITAVDPVVPGRELLFERFLSEERGEWPDIDLDLPSGDRRESVIQHVYEKYGRLGAAMTANVITYRGRSAAREVGKVLGFESPAVDRLAKIINHFDPSVYSGSPRATSRGEFIDGSDNLTQYLTSTGFDVHDPRVQLFGRLCAEMQDLPRHLGQHSGGMVICQGRLDTVVPLEPATMPGRVVVQWDKDDCADMGIVKVDLLGLGMMAALQDALALINGPAPARGDVTTSFGEARGPNPAPSPRSPAPSPEPPAPVPVRLELATIPAEDPDVYRLLCEADTVGIFQVESRAQMATLPRLKPKTFYDLVVQVAIIRPGPIVGQMVHPYLNRRAGREAVTYAHPSLEPILSRTLGVPLFQEQLLRIAMTAAGFTGGQAEELRRALGFKRSERRMKQVEVQLREGMARNGITGKAAEEIALQIRSFALYGFPESHAASFALLAYASAYLKVHYPAAFYTALLNNQPMGFYHPSTLIKDAQRRGVRFQPIDVQQSAWACTIEADGAIRLGLQYVHGLRRDVATLIAAGPSSSWLRAHGSGLTTAARLPASGFRSQEELLRCPKCGCDDQSMIERPEARGQKSGAFFCNNCSHDWHPARNPQARYASLEQLVAHAGLRRDEVVQLADIGALNAFGYDRRSAIWQAEKVVRPAGEMFQAAAPSSEPRASDLDPRPSTLDPCPLRPMTEAERLVADYAGTGVSMGRHPMALRRDELATRGIMRAIDLRRARAGRRVRVAGMVITRQRPGTAKGFVFLTLEDETGIANIIVRPDLFARDRLSIIEQPFLIIDGVLQHQDGVVSVRAESASGLAGVDVDFDAHDFY